MTKKSKVIHKEKETVSSQKIDKPLYNENDLLDVTEDLIKFLRLKSNKVVIQNEVFNFNHVLNDVAGMLSQSYKKNNMEVIFDIDKFVPRYMFADSLHLGQILNNLLEYMLQNTYNKELSVLVTQHADLEKGQQLRFILATHLMIEDKENIFESYYDEEARRYVGMGLFIANELTRLMGGTLHILDGDDGYQYFELIVPIEEKNPEQRKYRLPDKGLVGKKILIVDKSTAAAKATEKLFAYFRAEVTILDTETFMLSMPNFARYDIVALHNSLFDIHVLDALHKVKKIHALKLISLENLFSSDELILHNIIDNSLVKPLTQEYVFDTLIDLYIEKETGKNAIYEENSDDSNKLLTYRDTFEDTLHVTLESFSIFKGSHILIVEDNIINQKVVLSVLGKSGMKLSVANNGEEAVALTQEYKGKIDFIFMDINMPVLDGFRASELIRQDNRYDNVPIVALTALISEYEIEKMFDAGMNGYMPKPVQIEKLYSALSVFLSNPDEEIKNEPEIETKKVVSVQVDGLNIESALANMNQNDVFYKEVLIEFMDAYAQSDVVFERLVKERRYMQIKMLCIDMKGLTRTIGAKEMHDAINEIHQHILYNKLALLHNHIPRYRAELEKLRYAINTYLNS